MSSICLYSRKHSLGLALILACSHATAMPSVSDNPLTPEPLPNFGPNVSVFDPGMSVSEIKAVADAIHAKQVSNEMGEERYSLYFMPGTYGTEKEPLQIQVGYYTEVAGLGASPNDVHIHGAVEVYNQCFDDSDNPEFVGCFALNNFWRSLANLTINVNTLGQGGCESSANMWAVSQAVSMRRVDVINGNLTLMDYCTQPSFASGGYIADSRIANINDSSSEPAYHELVNGSQQQWYARNSEVAVWSNAVWNQVFSGMSFVVDSEATPSSETYPEPPYTALEKTPLSRERPYLYINEKGQYAVRVPAVQENSSGISWKDGMTAGRNIAIDDFFIATPSNSVKDINQALSKGKHVIFTPGVYDIDSSIKVNHEGTVLLGMGIATLTATDGAIALQVADVAGVVVAGITIDAGTVESPVLLQLGRNDMHTDRDEAQDSGDRKAHNARNNPTTLNDVYFRIGGPHIGKTDIALEVNMNNVLIDHTWIWRADHGIEDFDKSTGDFGDNERWVTNIGRNGLVVNGDHVTATGLVVEHFQEYNTIWNGEDGRVVLYQNELPYDPPTQADWTTPKNDRGWAAYKVADDVKRHQLWGGGVYVFNRNNPEIVTDNGYEVPETEGVVLMHIMTKNLSGPGTISAVVNGIGEAVNGDASDGPYSSTADNEAPSYVISYPDLVAYP